MTILDLHERLAAWPEDKRQEMLPGSFKVDCPEGQADVWPAAAVAAVICTGWLPGLDAESDIEDALRQFGHLIESEIVSQSQWESEIEGVLITLLQWGDEQVTLPTGTVPEPSRN
jgi:hypothetical protein